MTTTHKTANNFISYTKTDFESDQIKRWCPGCGDYTILAQMQRTMPKICEELDIKKENIVFISGIGCSSRFPYYMDTYGFHTIHGRAPTIATGLKVSRPDLQVWVVTGDGDGLSIGGNHLIHALRRNIDIKILLFNNQIYGLTKGQYSPTSEAGKKTKSSPMGSVEQPINPLAIAVAANASFIARTSASEGKHLSEILSQAAAHKGSAFIEIFQNCNVFNDGAFDSFTHKSVKADRILFLEDQQPMRFGKDRDKGIAIRANQSGLPEPQIVNINEVDDSELLVHDTQTKNTSLAHFLSQFEQPDLPVPLGIYRKVERPLYGDLLTEQIQTSTKAAGPETFFERMHRGDVWEVEN